MTSAARPRRVAVLAFDGISSFHLSVPLLVFGLEGVASISSRYAVTVCAERPGPLTTSGALGITVPSGLEAFAEADVVVLPSWKPPQDPSPTLVAAIRAAHDRGATVVGLCLGSWLVAAAGIADGRAVTTHWSAGPALAERFPAVDVRHEVLWCDEGSIVTSAGVAAGLDCCLHVVRRDAGSEYAATVARAIVLAPHRAGSQAQYIDAPLPPAGGEDPIDLAMAWAGEHLQDEITIDAWAATVALSRRHFTRRFAERVGTSPMRWLGAQRLDRARRLLETTDHAIPLVATLAGYPSPETLRHHFRAALGVSPTEHRAAFTVR